jgi:hypothetical protein
MAQADTNNSITASPECGLSLRLRRAGLRLEQRGCGYRLVCGSQVLLDRGPRGCELSLDQVADFTRSAGLVPESLGSRRRFFNLIGK